MMYGGEYSIHDERKAELMKLRKVMTLIVAFAMAFTVFGYGFAVQADAATAKPKKITLTANYKTVDIKGKVTVKVKSVSPAKASKAVTWKSSNKKIATVSSKGVVTGKKKGTVKITATSKKNKKVKKTITIKVKQIKPSLKLSNVTVYTKNGAKSVKAKMPGNVYNAGVSYKLSSTKYAKLNTSKATKGSVKITPNNKNSKSTTVKLTATSKENKKLKKTCTVTIRKSVEAIAFDSAKVKGGKYEMQSGTTDTVKASVTKPAYPYSKTLDYTSSNKNVATVDKNGVVTAKKAGTATIKATAHYGYKKSASYKLTVYDKLGADKGSKYEYALNTRDYDHYKVAGEKNGEALDIELTNNDLMNITGKGSIDYDWLNGTAESFEKASFEYKANDNYWIKKEGNKVTAKFGDGRLLSAFYVKDKSFTAGENGDYTVNFYTDETGQYQYNSAKFEKIGKTVTIQKNPEEKVSLTQNSDSSYTVIMVKDGETTEAAIDDLGNGVYTLSIDKSYVDNNKIIVKAYAK